MIEFHIKFYVKEKPFEEYILFLDNPVDFYDLGL